MAFIARIENGKNKIEWTALTPSEALRAALNCALLRSGFSLAELERLTIWDGLDIISAVSNSSSRSYSFQPKDGYKFSITRED